MTGAICIAFCLVYILLKRDRLYVVKLLNTVIIPRPLAPIA